MSWTNRVAWQEGMFLRAQHFQQQDRWTEAALDARVAALRPYPWGLTRLAINRGLLASGRFAVQDAAGVFEDGTGFDLSSDADLPVPLDLPPGTRAQMVYLAVPIGQPGMPEMADGSGAETRWALADFTAADSHSAAPQPARLQVGRLRLRYLLGEDNRAGCFCIGLARVMEIADRKVVLDEDWSPPSLLCAAAAPLAEMLSDIAGLLRLRAEALAARVTAPGPQYGMAQMIDFTFLQVVNRWQPLLAHWAQAALVHPADLYAALVQMTGELRTLTDEKTRLANRYPGYHHHDLQRSFRPVLADLRAALGTVRSPDVFNIPLKEGANSVFGGRLNDRGLLDSAQFVLVVRASVLAETLRQMFPRQVKIGPGEKIDELVRVQVTGIAVTALPVAPRKLTFTYTAGTQYFELDRNSPVWRDMRTSVGFAIHVSNRGEFPDLAMELYAVRGA